MNTVIVDGKKYELDPKSLTITESTIDADLCAEARIFDQYSSLLARARVQYETADALLKIAEAEANLSIRDAAEKCGKKLTEDGIKKLALVSEPYRAAVKRVNEANLDFRLLEEFVHSLSHKKDDLLELARNWRVRFSARETV